ncbi:MULTISPECIES: ABC transporter permease [Pseudoalteromonas]|uniref:ABC transporter permease n=1 Tax=Pseudoalteromonas obscura TaxID=3048491 RepID=A0ABT7EHT5_9GAMM|nr:MULTISPECIES: ABC transporter permease [Pseudoalteromonas]MBQ4836266.1 ABC transporter permease [Pseudoalteromonas luteoviolacea]MDK2594616.1 ABC transporter permease [Pseudoalteromonas sp. P94(2023)]
MGKYYFKLAWLSLKKTPLLSLLMIGTIAIGIAASMTTITVGYMMGQNPLPHKSERVAMVHLNSWDPSQPIGYRKNGEVDIPSLLTYQDAMALLAANKADKHVPFVSFNSAVRAENEDVIDAQLHQIRSTSRHFFSVFGAPFIYGGTWSEEADQQGQSVIVLSKRENDRLFQGANSVGEHIIVGTHLYRVVGVIDDWQPTPKFYVNYYDMYSPTLPFFVPLESQIQNNFFSPTTMGWYCWGDGPSSTLQEVMLSECAWIRFWVEFESEDKKHEYFKFMEDYTEEQRKVGRFARPEPNRLMSVTEYLEEEGAVSEENKIGIGFALAFLFACLCNVMSLMMTKFHGKGGEVGLRRAVGASKQNITVQFGFEAALIGFFGGVIGLLLTQLGLSALTDMYPEYHVNVMTMDITLMVSTVALAVSTSLLFGLWPIYRTSRVQLSSQLKSL